jgi:hypothetical protein
VRPSPIQIILVLVAVTAVVIVILATGLANDKAEPGSGGRVPVTYPAPDDSP